MQKVSVIIPVYNVEKYIANTISSVIKQTYKNIEIILVDDGSSDCSGSICDEWSKKDDRIKVIHKKNGGLSSARNTGLDNVTGEYVIFLDGDDYLALNAIEILIDVRTKINCDIVHFGYTETTINYEENIVRFSNEIEVLDETYKIYRKMYELGGEGASACTKMYNSSLFKELRFKEGILHEDEQLMTDLLDKVYKIVYIPDKLYYYVMRNNSIVRSGFNIKKLDILEISAERIKKLRELGFKDLENTEMNRYFNTMMYQYSIAKANKSGYGCREIKKQIKQYYKKYIYTQKGRMHIFYRMCSISPNFVNLYYMLRKCFGHLKV